MLVFIGIRRILLPVSEIASSLVSPQIILALLGLHITRPLRVSFRIMFNYIINPSEKTFHFFIEMLYISYCSLSSQSATI